MKIKKALACILAVAMVITLMPSMAFAATDNSVASVTKVKADDHFTAYLNLKVTGADPVTGAFDINLNNAEWYVTSGASNAVAEEATDAAITAGGTTAVAVSYTTTGSIMNLTTAGISVASSVVSDDSMRVTISGNIAYDSTVRLGLNLKAKDAGEDVTVTIDGQQSKISSGTYTVATVGESGTVASVIGSSIKKVSSDNGYVAGNVVKLTEVSANSVSTTAQGIRLTLPKKYSWPTDTSSIAAIFDGDMLSGSKLGASINASGAAVQIDRINAGTDSAIYSSVHGTDNNILDVYFPASRSSVVEILQIKPLFLVDTDAPTGDVTLTISNLTGEISAAEDLVIAQNVEENIDVKAIKDAPVVQNGMLNNVDKSRDYYVYVVLKENVSGALTLGKSVKFEFPEEVQILNDEQIAYSTAKDATKDSSYISYATQNKNTLSDDASSWTWTSEALGVSGKKEFTFRFPVTVKAGYTDDIEVTVSGAKAGLETQTVAVASVVNAAEMEAPSSEVKTGIQKQALGDIVITETDKGMLLEGKDVVLTLKDAEGAVINTSNAKIEVTEGDIDLGDLNGNANAINFRVKSKSTKASTIKISGLTVTLNRTLAEGAYDLQLGGDAIVDNKACNNGDFRGWSVKSAAYMNIITPADSVTVSEKVDAKFVIGEASYTNNGEATEMDAAAYIDKNNRTMVPIRYVANACGISENDIRWEQNTQTAIINGLNTVVTVKMGSNKLQTSTGEITMDTVAVNNNGRIYVPVRYIANALGANVSWDAATKTVTLTK